jgi:lambda family phage minor tail protein L
LRQEINKEFSKLNPFALISLFEIDTSDLVDNKLPTTQHTLSFHNSAEDKINRTVYFGDATTPNAYLPTPIEFINNELKGDGTQLPRPIVRVGNADGLASYYVKMTYGMIGAKVTRRRVFAKYLHGTTWGGTNPWDWYVVPGDPNLGYRYQAAIDVFYIESIKSENKHYVEFELTSSIDVSGINIPRRRMYATNCSFEYRNGSGCGYSDAPVATADNTQFVGALTDQGLWDASSTYNINDYVYIESSKLTEDGDPKKFYYVCQENGVTGAENKPTLSSSKWLMDACSLKINGCMLRFGDVMDALGLPFGGFPSLQRTELDG